MSALFRFLVLGSIAIAGISFILYQLLNFRFSLFGSKRQLQKDIDTLRGILSQDPTSLVELDKGEVELISSDLLSTQQYSRINSIYNGLISSIYEEPLAKYASKTYPDGNRGAIVVQYNQLEFTYVLSLSEIKVYKNGKTYGRISNRQELFLNDQANSIAKIELISEEFKAIKINDVKCANMSMLSATETGNSRLFSMMRFQNETDIEPFLALVLFDFIDDQLN